MTARPKRAAAPVYLSCAGKRNTARVPVVSAVTQPTLWRNLAPE